MVNGKANELSAFEPLPWPVDLTGMVVTADAPRTQRDRARFLDRHRHQNHATATPPPRHSPPYNWTSSPITRERRSRDPWQITLRKAIALTARAEETRTTTDKTITLAQ